MMELGGEVGAWEQIRKEHLYRYSAKCFNGVHVCVCVCVCVCVSVFMATLHTSHSFTHSCGTKQFTFLHTWALG